MPTIYQALYMIFSSQQPCEVGIIIIPLLMKRKLEVKQFVDTDSDLDLLTSIYLFQDLFYNITHCLLMK